MAQHDQVIDNAPGLAVRTDINAALAALFSSNSGSTAPTVTSGGQLWLDTSLATPLLKLRNAANTAWIIIASSDATDIGFGKRTSPTRFVWNQKADLSGKDIMVVDATIGTVSHGWAINFYDFAPTTTVLRGQIAYGSGAQAASVNIDTYDSAGTLNNRASLDATGLQVRAGDFLFKSTGGVLRGGVHGLHDNTTPPMTTMDAYATDGVTLISSVECRTNYVGLYGVNGLIRMGGTDRVTRAMVNCDPAANSAGSYAELRACDTTGATVNSIYVDGIGMRCTSDFYVLISSIIRAKYGADGSNGAYFKYFDTAGVFTNMLTVNATGASMVSAQGAQSQYRGVNNGNGNIRGAVGWNSDNATSALGWFICYDNTAVRQQRMEIDNTNGIQLLDGANAGQVLTTGNFPAKALGGNAVDYPVGSTLIFLCPAGSTMNRNQPVTMRLHATDNTMFQHTGSGSLLTGSWMSCGLMGTTAPIYGMARRIS